MGNVVWFHHTVDIALCSSADLYGVTADMTQLIGRALKQKANLCFGSWVLCCFCCLGFDSYCLCPGTSYYQNVAEGEESMSTSHPLQQEITADLFHHFSCSVWALCSCWSGFWGPPEEKLQSSTLSCHSRVLKSKTLLCQGLHSVPYKRETKR